MWRHDGPGLHGGALLAERRRRVTDLLSQSWSAHWTAKRAVTPMFTTRLCSAAVRVT